MKGNCLNRYPLTGMKRKVYLVFMMVSIWFSETNGYPKGAPPGSCKNMGPHHQGADAQSGSSPYSIHLDKSSVVSGGQVKVTLLGNGKTFKGFLIIIRSQGSNEARGTWSVDGEENAKVLECSEGHGYGVTHVDNSPKESVTVSWTAKSEPGVHEVFFTVVRDFTTFWVKQQTPGHSTITVN